MRPDHAPQGDPCTRCGKAAASHRPEHTPDGDPCSKCGLEPAQHRTRKRSRVEYFRARRRERPRVIIGIDGEGYTDEAGRHRYVYLAACTEGRLVSELHEPEGIRAEQVWAWLLALPKGALLVGFSLGYDQTKWVESWPDEAIYALMHPEERAGKKGPRPVRVAGYAVNRVSTRLTVRPEGKAQSRTVWDVFKFFQSSFVRALEAWDVGTEKERARIARMKQRRGRFEGIGARERRYCQSECMLLAKLVGTLLEAHEAAGLKLGTYYGPGSTAAVLLAQMGADKQAWPDHVPVPRQSKPRTCGHGDIHGKGGCGRPMRQHLTGGLAHAVLSAFTAGRFECSHVGPVRAPLWYADIASAYPYALAQLPCMRHGRWERVRGSEKHVRAELASAEVACVHYVLLPIGACEAWGPFPHRSEEGHILFPLSSGGGWAWLPEFRAAERLHPSVIVKEAWVWRRRCDCPPPYKETMVRMYSERLKWGRKARGMVIRLGLNACYGKSAQRVGVGRFRCMVRAGMITAMVRAMLLEAIASAKDPWNVLEVATDSILSAEPLTLPKPARLGTERAALAAKGKVLGAWDVDAETFRQGAMLLRPGMRFALSRKVRKGTAARGLGTAVLDRNRARLLRQWAREPMSTAKVQQGSMFHGAKSSIRRRTDKEWNADELGYEYVRDALYGAWSEPEPRQIAYTPAPKRDAVAKSHLRGGGLRLTAWSIQPDVESVPYGGKKNPLAVEAERQRELEEEQPGAEAIAVV